MCAEKGVKYLDVYQAVVNSSGALPDDAAVDGVHLKMAYCKNGPIICGRIPHKDFIFGEDDIR